MRLGKAFILKIEWDVKDIKALLCINFKNFELGKQFRIHGEFVTEELDLSKETKITCDIMCKIVYQGVFSEEWQTLLKKSFMYEGTIDDVKKHVSLLELIIRRRSNAAVFVKDDERHVRNLAEKRMDLPDVEVVEQVWTVVPDNATYLEGFNLNTTNLLSQSHVRRTNISWHLS